MKIKKKIPRSNREMLYELYADFKDANKQLEKEAKRLQEVENLFKRGTPGGTQVQHS